MEKILYLECIGKSATFGLHFFVCYDRLYHSGVQMSLKEKHTITNVFPGKTISVKMHKTCLQCAWKFQGRRVIVWTQRWKEQ